MPVAMGGIEGNGTAGKIDRIGGSGSGDVQGARVVSVQSNGAQRYITIGLDGNPATATGCMSKTASTLGLQSTGYGNGATFQANGSTRATPTCTVVVTGGIPTVCLDTSSDGECTIPMGKEFDSTTTGTTGVPISTACTGTAK